MKKLIKKFSAWQLILVIGMFLLTLTMIIPLLNILARSLSDPSVSPYMSGLDILPQKFNLINYKIILNHPILIPALLNSIFITIVGTSINILLTTMAAYALTRPGLVFKKVIMIFLIIMMLFDPGLVPEYLVIKELGLMGSLWSVILVTAVNVYYLIIMMRFFEEVPTALYEAATIDGAGHLKTFFHIAVPLAKPGIATITMFYAVVRWNEYFKSGIYMTKASKTTLQVLLRQFVVLNDTASLIGAENLLNNNEWAQVDMIALKNATIVIAILPILLIYPLVLKFYTKDIMAGGVKE
ncbi:carbohydrate ABC transporter permease [Niameybacter massiliensis]|uniref:carbohydrate ABC transporter permease n=1 Tax=Niameybacter massiliensis TaxID=1658108 RepID=UPI0006B41545|nr:carbohydrate ABC transporter permease [Niameybacter massiliensis]